MNGALFSPCRTWRYSLTREIRDPEQGCLDDDELGGTVTFIGLMLYLGWRGFEIYLDRDGSWAL